MENKRKSLEELKEQLENKRKEIEEERERSKIHKELNKIEFQKQNKGLLKVTQGIENGIVSLFKGTKKVISSGAKKLNEIDDKFNEREREKLKKSKNLKNNTHTKNTNSNKEEDPFGLNDFP